MGEEYGVGLAKELMSYTDRDTRTLREKLKVLERGDSVRIVTESQDVLAWVETDARVREDVDFTEGVVVEAPVEVYGDSPAAHQHTAISWWEMGPVLLIVGDEEERVERLEIK